MESKRYKIRIIGHIKRKDNHVEYEGIIEGLTDKKEFSFLERYSNLKTLNDQLRKETQSNNFPKFPPKKFFGSEDEKFLTKREQELNKYFEIISEKEEFSKLPSLLAFIEEKKNSSHQKTKQTSTKQLPIGFHSKKSEKSFSEIKRLSPEEMKKLNKECEKVVKEYHNKFVDLDYEIPQDFKESYEEKFKKVIEEENIMKERKFKESITLSELGEGNDINFEEIGKSEERIKKVEDTIREKIEKMGKEYNEISEIYNTNGILIKI